MPVREINEITRLPFGRGLVGADRHLIVEDKVRFQVGIAQNIHEISNNDITEIDCMDERETVALADGENDPKMLAERKTGHLPGGSTLATLKAGIAADATFLRGIKTMQEGYELTKSLLASLGIRDAAHEGCGASMKVVNSVAERLDMDMTIKSFSGLGINDDVSLKVL